MLKQGVGQIQELRDACSKQIRNDVGPGRLRLGGDEMTD